MKMPHAATACLVADPAQDYEETLEVWGVYVAREPLCLTCTPRTAAGLSWGIDA